MKKYSIWGKVWAVCLLAMIVSSSNPTVYAANPNESGFATGTTLLWLTPTERQAYLDDVQALGAKWIRIDFSWAEIQPQNRTTYKWHAYDAVVQAAHARHLKVLATLAYTPDWASDAKCREISSQSPALRRACKPRAAADFARFARAAVLRYNLQGVYAWEIWNEPNLTGYWRSIDQSGRVVVSPADYAEMANLAALQIKHYDPGAVVIAGSLAPLFEAHQQIGMRQSDYLTQLLPKLERRLFDGISVHPYCWPKSPARQAIYNGFYTVDNGPISYNLRKIMDHSGWGNEAIWATEFGASTRGKIPEGAAAAAKGHPRPDHVSEAKQAQIIAQGLQLWRTKQRNGPIFLYSQSDEWLTHGGNSNQRGYGLRRQDGSKKPAYTAVYSALHH